MERSDLPTADTFRTPRHLRQARFALPYHFSATQAPFPCLRSACHRPSPARHTPPALGADRAAARRAAWPCREPSAAALAAHRGAPWGTDGRGKAPRPLERVAEPTGGQHVAPPAASGSRRRRLEREDGAYREPPPGVWGRGAGGVEARKP
jgi:hypothetical protein